MSDRTARQSVVSIGHTRLTLADIQKLSEPETRIELAVQAVPKIEASRRLVETAVNSGETIYGVTTGFGALSDQLISPDDARQLQINLLRSHASGTGKLLEDEVVRLMLALRAHALALGYSGVRRVLIDRLIEFYNREILPVVPSQGSVGASGDLAPLAHLALPVAGEGRVRLNGDVLDSQTALQAAGLEPLELEPKEALALINGTQAMTAIGAIAAIQARRTVDLAIAAAAMTVIAMNGRVSSFDERIHKIRPHPGQMEVAGRMRRLLQNWQPDASRSRSVQDRYSLRAVPQVIGAVVDTLAFASTVFETEFNAVTDNPLFFADDGESLNGANFHGHPIALACDHLKTAVASLTTFSERRIASMVDPRASGLPAFLAVRPGLQSGLMIPHYLAASIVSENRVLAHPASVDSLSTSADVEDYNSMGALAARNLATVVENAARVIAIELICAAQAIDLAGAMSQEIPVMVVYRQLRKEVPFLEQDEFGIGDQVEDVAGRIRSGSLVPPGEGLWA